MLFQIVAYLLGHTGSLVGVELSALERPSEAATVFGLWYDVEVDVGDRLEGGLAVVLQDVEVHRPADSEHGLRDARQNPSDSRRGLVGEGVECDGLLLGDHKGVPGAERVDVEEGEDVLVLVHLVTGYLASDDEGEDARLRLAHADPLI